MSADYLQVVSDIARAVAPLVPEVGTFVRVIEMIVEDKKGGISTISDESSQRAAGRAAYLNAHLAGLFSAIERTIAARVMNVAEATALNSEIIKEVLLRWPRF